MTYELALKLKNAGFPSEIILETDGETIWECKKAPSLSELIEACGDKFGGLHTQKEFLNSKILGWVASGSHSGTSKGNAILIESKDNPEEAVAELWFKIK